MATCLINVTGTSGSVLVRYVLAGEQNDITANLGDSFIIPDTATAITFTTLSGDAIAAGAPCTPTPVAFNYYDLVLKALSVYYVSGFFYNSVYYPITLTSPSSFYDLKTRIETAKPEITLLTMNIVNAGVNTYVFYNFKALSMITLEMKAISIGQPDGRILIESEITPP